MEDLLLVNSKFDRIFELARGKDVLDIGCLGGDRGIDISRTPYAMISSVAKSCLGIDLDGNEIERWRVKGYDVVRADAEDFHLGRKFDVIAATDVIEHLANPGLFLECVREHLRPTGWLYIVTPNALSLNCALKTLFGFNLMINPEHTCWYDRITLRQLLERSGFQVVEEYWQDYQQHPVAALMTSFRKNLAAHMILVAQIRHAGSTA